MTSEFDFIVIGGGASGSVIASRLASSKAKPSVLLLEAGGENKDESYLHPSSRFSLAFTTAGLNWGYKTAPQTQLKGQEIDYSRGRGLGGSTAINFSCWIIGSDEDFNEWARVVGDDVWKWESVKERFKKIEHFHAEVPQAYKKYINPQAKDHGTDGPLHLSYADTWEKDVGDIFKAADEAGFGTNPDINSGNPIGMGLGPATAYRGLRTTASTAYLSDIPTNLTVKLNSPVAKVLFDRDGKTAIGVQNIAGEQFHAKKDVIISAGALNSPQILMLSGIGDSEQLKGHGIEVIKHLPYVGKNLQDHVFATATIIQTPGTSDRMAFETDENAKAEANEQYDKDKTGRLNEFYSCVPMGWFKSDAVYASTEFADLPEETQAHLKKPTVPSFEMATHTPPLYLGDYELQKTDSYLCGLAFLMNPHSHGEVTLVSPNPADAPKIDPKFLSHPYDRRVMIEAMRSLMALFDAPTLKKNTVKWVGCPKSKSDEDIWEHVSANLMSSWHMCSTVKMGKEEDETTCCDREFRVLGVKNLRVVDLSVLPLLTNNHTQSTAYLVGETAAEKMIAEYGLDK